MTVTKEMIPQGTFKKETPVKPGEKGAGGTAQGSWDYT